MRRTKIVATLGPATDGRERELIEAGVDAARLNFSHGNAEEHRRRCAAVRHAAITLGKSVAVIQDLQGPKIRVGTLVDGGPIQLVVGQMLAITSEPIVGTNIRISCSYPQLALDVRAGDSLLLDDGRIRLAVEGTDGSEVQTRVVEGGPLLEHKGINLPGVRLSTPALTEKDREDLRFGLLELDVDYVALSFVRTPDDVRQAIELIGRHGHRARLIAKLEKDEAIERLQEIVEQAHAVMVARGDLGVEVPPEQVPVLQKLIIQQANRAGIPVITATEMLQSMVTEERPTRAEATDVANAVWDGSDALMLSAETAVGRDPVHVVRTMDRIIRAAEAAQLPSGREAPRGERRAGSASNKAAAVTHAAKVLAEDLGAVAIVGVTGTGTTTQLLSRGRPSVPIYAFSPDERVCRQLALWWGVAPVHFSLDVGAELDRAAMERSLMQCGAAKSGDAIVLTGVHPFRPGMPTNFVQSLVLGEA